MRFVGWALLCLGQAVPSAGERFHSGVRLHRVNDGAHGSALEEVAADFHSQEALGPMQEKPPDLEEVKKWTDFFASPDGGYSTRVAASGAAIRLLKEDHPDLEQVEKWSQCLNSWKALEILKEGDLPDFEEVKKWTEDLVEEQKLWPKDACAKAVEILKGTPPDFDEVKKWANFLASPDGGYSTRVAASAEAIRILKEEDHPDLEQVEKWSQCLNSWVALEILKEGDLPDFEEVNKWTEYLVEAQKLWPKKACAKAVEILKGTPPDFDEVKRWADFLASPDGGYSTRVAASAAAIRILKEDHPDLEQVKKWSQCLSSWKALEILKEGDLPDFEEVKKWTEYLVEEQKLWPKDACAKAVEMLSSDSPDASPTPAS